MYNLLTGYFKKLLRHGTMQSVHPYLWNYSEGFTLAEVLITLGIIGIVAAMTIPSLMTKIRERQTVTRLLTSQSVLTQAIRLAEEEYGGAATWTTKNASSQEAFAIAEKLKPFLKISVDCGLSDSNNNCAAKKYYFKNGSAYNRNYARDTRYYKISLMNGAAVWWKSGGEDAKASDDVFVVFFTDTNGTALPNKIGLDVFVFAYQDDTLIPWGASGTSYSYKNHCEPENSTGWGCAYWVTRNKNLDYLH